MVRRNWQKRMESAKARRDAAKNRKQQRDNRGQYKAKVYEFLTLLDRFYGSGGRGKGQKLTLHIWTDTCPSDYNGHGLLYDENDDARSNFIDIDEAKKSKRGKNNGDGKKKSHPRSNKKQQDALDAGYPHNVEEVPQLCSHHFFAGLCQDGSGRKGGKKCQHYAHYESEKETLYGVVGSKTDACRSTLAESQEAAARVSLEANNVSVDDTNAATGTDMVYHIPIVLSTESTENDGSVTIFDTVSKVLSSKTCGLGNVVYVAMEKNLLFDRHRDGLLLSEETLDAVFGHSRAEPKATTILKATADSKEKDPNQHQLSEALLFAHILEHILTFLPESCISIMKRVCKAWKDEIGTSSPELWRHMLQRRHWPMPVVPASDSNDSDEIRSVSLFRDTFVSHYTVVRNAQNIQKAMCALHASRKSVEYVGGSEWVVQAFSSRRGAPQRPNKCMGVKVWSPNRVLAGYSEDCTLRLFESVAKKDESGAIKKVCRQVVCVVASPYKNARRKSCDLEAMDIDDELVVCLCSDWSEDGEGLKQYLVAINREDLLCASGGTAAADGTMVLDDDATVHVVDVSDVVLRSVLDNDEEFASHFGYGVAEVNISASPSIAACGHGLVLLEIMIFVTHDDLSRDRKLVLISLDAGAVVWTWNRTNDRGNVALARSRPLASQRNHSSCFVAATTSSQIAVGAEVVRKGARVDVARLSEERWMMRSSENEWVPGLDSPPPVTVTSTDVVVVDSVERGDFGTTDYAQICRVFFFPLLTESDISLSASDMLHLGEPLFDRYFEPFRIESIGDHHVLILCRFFVLGDDSDDEELEEREKSIFATVLHVPTRQEVERIFLMDMSDDDVALRAFEDYPMFVSCLGGTIGVGLSHKGMIITGSDVRFNGKDSLSTQQDDHGMGDKPKKKKKKRQSNSKTSKKDGFARGMSLRG